MTTDVQMRSTTLVAGADLSGAASKYKAIAVGGTIAPSNVTAIGLLRFGGRTGENITVAYDGEMKAVAGDTVAIGARLIVTTSGFLITATSGGVLGSNCGRALEAANSGDLFRCLLSFPACT